jgi:lysophospholipase L1-like esterase
MKQGFLLYLLKKVIPLGTALVLCFLLFSCTEETTEVENQELFLNTYQNRKFFGIVDSTLAEQFPFIHFERNHYKFYTKGSSNFEKLYFNIKQMVLNKDRKINFYHIGGSHLQADVYTHEMRTNLQKNWADLPGERGLVFPFDLGGTNAPWNYAFTSKNKWTFYKSTLDRPDSLEYGILGAVIETQDSIVDINFKYDKTKVKPPFDRLRIYHNKGFIPYTFQFGKDSSAVVRKQTNAEIGYTDVQFNQNLTEFHLTMTRDSIDTFNLQILGFQLSNNFPGISYTTIGVNGASLPTYLRNKYFEEQLREFPPDFFAFSVGTNDANMPYDKFDPSFYKANLDSMIRMVLRVNPNCAILLTVPNDAYFERKFLNKNVARERKVILELAKKYEAAVWDMYGIMGELGAAKTWARNRLMRKDLVHFTATGYRIKGDMFFESFVKWLEQMDIRDRKLMYQN